MNIFRSMDLGKHRRVVVMNMHKVNLSMLFLFSRTFLFPSSGGGYSETFWVGFLWSGSN